MIFFERNFQIKSVCFIFIALLSFYYYYPRVFNTNFLVLTKHIYDKRIKLDAQEVISQFLNKRHKNKRHSYVFPLWLLSNTKGLVSR